MNNFIKKPLDNHPHVCYIITMKNDPTYTLWNGVALVATRPHTTENYIDLLGIAQEASGHALIYSSYEDAPVYDSHDEGNAPFDREDGMTDVEADADTLASAGYGTDEDYGYFGDCNYE